MEFFGWPLADQGWLQTRGKVDLGEAVQDGSEQKETESGMRET